LLDSRLGLNLDSSSAFLDIILTRSNLNEYAIENLIDGLQKREEIFDQLEVIFKNYPVVREMFESFLETNPAAILEVDHILEAIAYVSVRFGTDYNNPKNIQRLNDFIDLVINPTIIEEPYKPKSILDLEHVVNSLRELGLSKDDVELLLHNSEMFAYASNDDHAVEYVLARAFEGASLPNKYLAGTEENATFIALARKHKKNHEIRRKVKILTDTVPRFDPRKVAHQNLVIQFLNEKDPFVIAKGFSHEGFSYDEIVFILEQKVFRKVSKKLFKEYKKGKGVFTDSDIQEETQVFKEGEDLNMDQEIDDVFPSENSEQLPSEISNEIDDELAILLRASVQEQPVEKIDNDIVKPQLTLVPSIPVKAVAEELPVFPLTEKGLLSKTYLMEIFGVSTEEARALYKEYLNEIVGVPFDERANIVGEIVVKRLDLEKSEIERLMNDLEPFGELGDFEDFAAIIGKEIVESDRVLQGVFANLKNVSNFELMNFYQMIYLLKKVEGVDSSKKLKKAFKKSQSEMKKDNDISTSLIKFKDLKKYLSKQEKEEVLEVVANVDEVVEELPTIIPTRVAEKPVVALVKEPEESLAITPLASNQVISAPYFIEVMGIGKDEVKVLATEFLEETIGIPFIERAHIVAEIVVKRFDLNRAQIERLIEDLRPHGEMNDFSEYAEIAGKSIVTRDNVLQGVFANLAKSSSSMEMMNYHQVIYYLKVIKGADSSKGLKKVFKAAQKKMKNDSQVSSMLIPFDDLERFLN
jgi:hypothetical protein